MDGSAFDDGCREEMKWGQDLVGKASASNCSEENEEDESDSALVRGGDGGLWMESGK